MRRDRGEIQVFNFYNPLNNSLDLTYSRITDEPYMGVQLAEDIIAGFVPGNIRGIKMLRILNAREHLKLYTLFDNEQSTARLLGGFKWNTRPPRERIIFLLNSGLSTQEFIDQWVIYEPQEKDWSWERTYGRR